MALITQKGALRAAAVPGNLYILPANPRTVHWGYFDAQLSPRLAIDSGERVTISSVSGGPEMMPAAPFVIPPALPAIHARHTPKLGPHMLTGPVAVKGATQPKGAPQPKAAAAAKGAAKADKK